MSDASKICLQDTTTITWALDFAALQANVEVSEEDGNALTIGASGLNASIVPRALGRAGATALVVGIPTGAQQNVGSFVALTTRFAEPASFFTNGVPVSGLYHATAIVSWATSAAGTYRAVAIQGTSFGTQYPAVTWTSALASAFTPNQFVTAFDGIIPMIQGTSLGMFVQHDIGANVNLQGANERIGVELMLNLLMET